MVERLDTSNDRRSRYMLDMRTEFSRLELVEQRLDSLASTCNRID
jgi:hypothetical protein